jgi:hypothetical protein
MKTLYSLMSYADIVFGALLAGAMIIGFGWVLVTQDLDAQEYNSRCTMAYINKGGKVANKYDTRLY